MSEVEAYPIEAVLSSTVVDDEFVVFSMRQEGGEPFNIALPANQLTNLLLMCVQASARLRRSEGADPNLKWSFPLEWWEIAEDTTDPNTVSLTLRMEGGAEISYRLGRDAAQRFRETLSHLLEPTQTMPPDQPRH